MYAYEYNSHMANRGELYSARVDGEGGRRYYFFNIKTDRRDTLFMTIVESTKRADGSFMRNEVFLYEEDVMRFGAELNRALNRLSSMRQNRDIPGASDATDNSRSSDS